MLRDNVVTSNIAAVKRILKAEVIHVRVKEINESKWQGVTLRYRYSDESLVNKVFTWLTKWKSCPVDVVNELQSIHLQTIHTLTFTKFRGAVNNTNCKSGNETEKHLSNCAFSKLWLK